MTDKEGYGRLSDDAAKWVAAFRETALKLDYSDMDTDWLTGWFANAIKNSHEIRVGKDAPLAKYVDAVFVGGNHLATWIGVDHPSHHTAPEEALNYYGGGIKYDVWCCWRAIMRLRDAVEYE